MIKKYLKFLEGFKITREVTISEAFSDFIEFLKECQSEFFQSDELQFHESYSYRAQDRSVNYDPDEDFKLVDEFMSKRGFDQETVARLSESYGQKAFNIRIETINPSRCGPIDYYLYKITEKTFPLQGYSWETFMNSDIKSLSGDVAHNEILIKFGYGWHNTKYGRLCIEQNLGSVDEFIKVVLEQLPNYLFRIFVGNRVAIFRNIPWKVWIGEFTLMDGSFYIELDEMYNSYKQYLINSMTQDEFSNLILKGIEKFKNEGLKLNVTKIGEEVRVSI